MPETSAAAENRERLLMFRETVASAVAVLRSQEAQRTYVSLSIEELVDRRIGTLIDSEDQLRRSRREQVQKIYDDLVGQIEEMKATDPSEFSRMSSSDNANSDEEG
jgi:hypothetical protein